MANKGLELSSVVSGLAREERLSGDNAAMVALAEYLYRRLKETDASAKDLSGSDFGRFADGQAMVLNHILTVIQS